MKKLNKFNESRTQDKVIKSDGTHVHFLDLELSIDGNTLTLEGVLNLIMESNRKNIERLEKEIESLKEINDKQTKVNKATVKELKDLRKRVKELEEFGEIK